MSTKHTPGPWFEHEGSIYSGVPTVKKPGYLEGYDKCICELDDMDIGPRKRKANARLIAAAPAMLEALKAAQGALDNSNPAMAHYAEANQRHAAARQAVDAALIAAGAV